VGPPGEPGELWTWFLSFCIDHLPHLKEMKSIVLLSDRGKGLNSEECKVMLKRRLGDKLLHGHCVRHIVGNLIVALKKQNKDGGLKRETIEPAVMAAARAPTAKKFEEEMAFIKTISEHAYVYLRDINPATWTYHAAPYNRYMQLCSNIVESLNGATLSHPRTTCGTGLCMAMDVVIIEARKAVLTELVRYQNAGNTYVQGTQERVDFVRSTASKLIVTYTSQGRWVVSPTIKEQGDRVELTITPDGTPCGHYEWQRSGQRAGQRAGRVCVHQRLGRCRLAANSALQP